MSPPLNYPKIPKNGFYRICIGDKISAKFSNEDELITTSLRYDLKLSLKDSISYEQVGRITIEQNGIILYVIIFVKIKHD